MRQQFNITKIFLKNLGAFFAANAAKNRAFRSKSSDLPMQILWAFRYNPWRIGKQRICVSKFATNPIARPQTGAFSRGTRHYFFVNETNAEQLIDFAPEGNNAKVNALLKGIVLSQKILSGVQGIARKVYRQIQKDINPKKSTIKEIKDEALPYLHDFEGELTFRDRDAVLDAVVEIARGAVTSQVKLWSMSSRIKEVIHESFDREVIPKQMNALIESLFIFTGITVMVDRVNLSDPYLLRERMISDDHSIVFVLPIQMGERVGELVVTVPTTVFHDVEFLVNKKSAGQILNLNSFVQTNAEIILQKFEEEEG